MARGRVPTTGKINAIVLAFKAAISPVGGTADKRAGNRHSPALCRRCTQAGVPPLHLFQGLNFLSSGVLLKKQQQLTWLPFHQMPAAFLTVVWFLVSRYFAQIAQGCCVLAPGRLFHCCLN